MQWETYREMYRSYVMASSQVQIVTLLAVESVRDFPKNLPDSLRQPLREGMKQLSRSISSVLEAASKKRTRTVQISPPRKDPTKGKLLELVMTSVVSQIDLKSREQIDQRLQEGFERLLLSQPLVMLYAYLDAFMADTLRAICATRPDVLKTGKKIEWSTALGFENKDQLLTHLTERYVFEFGWLSIAKRLDLLAKDIGVAVAAPQTELALLEWGENIRHIAVHNGARVSAEFIDRTGRKDLALGQFVPLTSANLDQISYAAQLLASDLFVATSKKFFKIEENQLTGVLQRSKPKGSGPSRRSGNRRRSAKKK